MKKKVYVAGKLNDMAVDYLYNVHKMMKTAEKLRLAGYSIFVPALDLLMGISFGYKNYHDYFDNSQPWIVVSDAIFLTPGWETSKGTREEIKFGWNNNIPVFDNLGGMNQYFHYHDKNKCIVGMDNERGYYEEDIYNEISSSHDGILHLKSSNK